MSPAERSEERLWYFQARTSKEVKIITATVNSLYSGPGTGGDLELVSPIASVCNNGSLFQSKLLSVLSLWQGVCKARVHCTTLAVYFQAALDFEPTDMQETKL